MLYIHPSIHPRIRPSINSFIHSFISLPVPIEAYSSIHVSIYPSIHLRTIHSKTLSGSHVSQPTSKVAYLSIHNFPVFPDPIYKSPPLANWVPSSSPSKLNLGFSPFLPPLSPFLRALPITSIHSLFVAVQLFIHSNLHPLMRLAATLTLTDRLLGDPTLCPTPKALSIWPALWVLDSCVLVLVFF